MARKAVGQVLVWILLFSTVAGLLTAKPVDANPFSMMPDNIVMTIQSPKNGAIYNVGTLPLYFTVEYHNPEEYSTRYILNDQSPVDLPTWIIGFRTIVASYGIQGPNNSMNWYPYNYSINVEQGKALLSNLPNGKYSLTVQRYVDAYNNSRTPTGINIINSTSISFTIDTASRNTTPVFLPPHAPYPKITFDSPKSNYVALLERPYAQGYESFHSNLLPSWVGYSLDGHINTTIPIYGDYKDIPVGSENLPLYNIYGGSLNLAFHFQVNIPLGSHSMTLYANDSVGNWATPQTIPVKVITFEEYASVPTRHPIFNQTALYVTTDSGTMIDFAVHGDTNITQISDATLKTDEDKCSLSFSVTGPSGTTGFCNITIPKREVPNAVTPIIYIDGKSTQNQGCTQDANSYYVWYTTSFSSHQVTVVFNLVHPIEPSSTSIFFPTQAEASVKSTRPPALPPTPVLTPILAAVIAIVAFVVAAHFRRKKVQPQQFASK